MRVEPRLGFGLRDDREDLDFLLEDVIEDPDVAHAEPILWAREASEALDAALGDPGWFVSQMCFEGVSDDRPVKGGQGPAETIALGRSYGYPI
jgi:hypothetical protein